MSEKESAEIKVGLYKAYLDDLGRLGGRHETIRAFYLSVISALFTFLGLASPTGVLLDERIASKLSVAVVGILVCVSWLLHMKSFGQLFKAKIGVLEDLEATLLLQPFTTENRRLANVNRTRITDVDQKLAAAAGVLFVVIFAWTV
jgi:hypothetical protein